MEGDFSHFRKDCKLTRQSAWLKPKRNWFDTNTIHLRETAKGKFVLTLVNKK